MDISIIIPTHPRELGLLDCLKSLQAEVENFSAPTEILLICPDCQSVQEALNQIRLPIQWLKTEKLLGPSEARNYGWKKAKGEICFFLDSDCTVNPGWLKQGLDAFSDKNTGAVEGPIRYAHSSPSVRDLVPINPIYNLDLAEALNPPAQDFAAANIAYRRELLEKVGGFDDQRFKNGREDTDLGNKVSRISKILFAPRMSVIHRKSFWTPKKLATNARRYQADVLFFREWCHFPFRWGRVLHPRLLLMALFPPYFFTYLLPRIRSAADVTFLPFLYFYLWHSRLHLWKSAIRNRVFVV